MQQRCQIARMLAGCRSAAHAGTTPLDVGARMIVTSGLAELNRARQGRAELRRIPHEVELGQRLRARLGRP